MSSKYHYCRAVNEEIKSPELFLPTSDTSVSSIESLNLISSLSWKNNNNLPNKETSPQSQNAYGTTKSSMPKEMKPRDGKTSSTIPLSKCRNTWEKITRKGEKEKRRKKHHRKNHGPPLQQENLIALQHPTPHIPTSNDTGDYPPPISPVARVKNCPTASTEKTSADAAKMWEGFAMKKASNS